MSETLKRPSQNKYFILLQENSDLKKENEALRQNLLHLNILLTKTTMDSSKVKEDLQRANEMIDLLKEKFKSEKTIPQSIFSGTIAPAISNETIDQSFFQKQTEKSIVCSSLQNSCTEGFKCRNIKCIHSKPRMMDIPCKLVGECLNTKCGFYHPQS